MFPKMQIAQPQNGEYIGDCSIIDNSKAYMSIEKSSQMD
jgi:hypothetical protein